MRELSTRHLTVTIDDAGHISSLVGNGGGDYRPPGVRAPLLTIRVEGHDLAPTFLTRRASSLLLGYEGPVTAEIGVSVEPTHVAFELQAIEPLDAVELVSWGPFATTIGDTIGETVGVVRDRDFAIGIQALNAKTLGGIPNRDDDVMPSYNIFAGGDYSDIAPESEEAQLFRGNVAVAAEHGSNLQAYCRDRSRDRIIANWGHPRYVAPAYDDGGVVGSRIALFGCPPEAVMPTIAAIEKAEGLPHPTLDGAWAKTSRAATAAYLILDFSEATIDQAIATTRAAGLRYLYHSAPFSTWGHFALKPDLFPNGWQGFEACVKKAAQRGVEIGFHTLSNFTTTNDPYVTPRPDPRLARIGTSVLGGSIDARVRTIAIEDPAYFRGKTALNSVVIGNELIVYKRVSSAPPWRLLHCTRGAFGTRAASHTAGSEIGRLMDHPYQVFLTNAELAQEQARRIADFCNLTGARQLSFDGLEGNWSTGMGQYGRTLFTQAWYEALAPELRGKIVNDASNPGHFNWHIYTRMNWGEPWYAGFRESQTQYRLKNQAYFSRNLMPRMLGWFALRGDTSLEDVEWLLARAAGFDAGFALATSLQFAGDQIMPGNEIQDRGGQSNLQAILAAVREWETARMAGLFPEHLKAALQDVSQEFHLQRLEGQRWHLFPVHSVKARLHSRKRRLLVDNPHRTQALGFILQNVGQKPLGALALTSGKRRTALAQKPLQPGQILRRAGEGRLAVYDAEWRLLEQVEMPDGEPMAAPGAQEVVLDWPDPRAGQALCVEYRTAGEPTLLG